MNVNVNFLPLIVILVLKQNGICAVSAAISCKDGNGNSVDWFYAYKLPSTYNSTDNKDSGLSFLYITSRSSDQKRWSMSDKTIDDPDSIIGRTVEQGYIDEDRLIVAYNDEPPTGDPIGTDGHTKGILVADEHSGFWLIHSVPRYPDYSTTYSYPSSGRHYGQSFLCISVDSTQIDKIGVQLIYNEPDIYLNSTSQFGKIYPLLYSAVMGKRINKPPYWNVETIQSTGGVDFKSFAKSRRFRKELYEDLVAQNLNANLFAETWRHGTGLIPSNCPTAKRSVWNVSTIKMDELRFEFNSTVDHSKWAVSTEGSWICVGDINRAEHQKLRGGGTVCQQSPVSEAYSELIKVFLPCRSQMFRCF